MPVKPGQPLVSLDLSTSMTVLNHPAQRSMIATIADLITRLRACETPGDMYEFQRHLFTYLYEVEERRSECSRVVKRLKRSASVPAEVPVPANGDPAQLATWELEVYVCDLLARQLRTVGDGLAWTCFGYDRRPILAMSRNDSPGPMYGKKGLPYELGAIHSLWKSEGRFALHHDLTNCLRIADLTEFTAGGNRQLREIKATPHTERKQMERAQAVVDAIMHGGVLPGSDGDSRFIELQEPYVTNLKALNDLLQLSKRNGNHGMKLPQGRAVVASSLPTVVARWKDDPEAGADFFETTKQQAWKRAGIVEVLHHIKGYSGDSAARSPSMAPWTVYPFSPLDCAGLICDMLVFETTVSADALVESLERAGVKGEILLPMADTTIAGGMPVVKAHWGGRTVTWHAQGLNQLLYELAEPDALARGIAEVLHMGSAPDYPVLVYADERSSWFGGRIRKGKRLKARRLAALSAVVLGRTLGGSPLSLRPRVRVGTILVLASLE
jgi:hypothetical protein